MLSLSCGSVGGVRESQNQSPFGHSRKLITLLFDFAWYIFDIAHLVLVSTTNLSKSFFPKVSPSYLNTAQPKSSFSGKHQLQMDIPCYLFSQIFAQKSVLFCTKSVCLFMLLLPRIIRHQFPHTSRSKVTGVIGYVPGHNFSLYLYNDCGWNENIRLWHHCLY